MDTLASEAAIIYLSYLLSVVLYCLSIGRELADFYHLKNVILSSSGLVQVQCRSILWSGLVWLSDIFIFKISIKLNKITA